MAINYPTPQYVTSTTGNFIPNSATLTIGCDTGSQRWICAGGHVWDTQVEGARYIDGLVVGNCGECGERISIPPKWAEKLDVLKAQILQMMDGEDIELVKGLAEVLPLVDVLKEQREQIDDLLDVVEVMKRKAAQQLLG